MQDAYGEMKAGGGAVRELQPYPPSDTPHLLVPITARMLSTLLPPSVFFRLYFSVSLRYRFSHSPCENLV
jgi:hypothetical protein